MYNVANLLTESAAESPDKDAIVYDSIRLTYSQINAMANQVANGLKALGIRKGDKVALSCPNLPYFPPIYYGILKAGAIFVPSNRGNNTRVPPFKRQLSSTDMPKEWNRGNTPSDTSSGCESNNSEPIMRFMRMFEWVSSAPLGRPVVPEV